MRKARNIRKVTEGVSNTTEVLELIREQYLDRQETFKNSLPKKPSKFRTRPKRDNRF